MSLFQRVKLPRRLKHHLGLSENLNLTSVPFILGFHLRAVLRRQGERQRKRRMKEGSPVPPDEICPAAQVSATSLHIDEDGTQGEGGGMRTQDAVPAGNAVYTTGRLPPMSPHLENIRNSLCILSTLK